MSKKIVVNLMYDFEVHDEDIEDMVREHYLKADPDYLEVVGTLTAEASYKVDFRKEDLRDLAFEKLDAASVVEFEQSGAGVDVSVNAHINKEALIKEALDRVGETREGLTDVEVYEERDDEQEF